MFELANVGHEILEVMAMSETIVIQGRELHLRRYYNQWYWANEDGFSLYRDGIVRDDWATNDHWPTEAAAREFALKHADQPAEPASDAGRELPDRPGMWFRDAVPGECDRYEIVIRDSGIADTPFAFAGWCGKVPIHGFISQPFTFLARNNWHPAEPSDQPPRHDPPWLRNRIKMEVDTATSSMAVDHADELAKLLAEVERLTVEYARRWHGATGLCCQLRLQEKERADKATARAEAAERELAEAADLNNEMKSLLDTACDERDALAEQVRVLRAALTELRARIGTTPSGLLSIVDDSPTRMAVAGADAALAAGGAADGR